MVSRSTSKKLSSTPKSDVLSFAERLCASKNAKLTKNRADVFLIVHNEGKPIGAYEILSRLSDEKNLAKPPTVYRALEFLEKVGLVHKVETLNAFMSCATPGHVHSAQILICDRCGKVEEVNDKALLAQFTKIASQHDFKLDRAVCEIHGLCAICG